MTDHCSCPNPGYCPRFRREISGRLYELCRGVNCSLALSEQYRTLWQAQAENLPQEQYPPIIRQAWAYAKDRATWETAGRPEVSDETYAQRRSLCLVCQHRDPEHDRCRLCGCWLVQTSLGDALRWATKECPNKVWLATLP